MLQAHAGDDVDVAEVAAGLLGPLDEGDAIAGELVGQQLRLLAVEAVEAVEVEVADRHVAVLVPARDGVGRARYRHLDAERVRGAYQFRTNRFRARLDDGDDGAIESRSQDYQRLRRELLDAERQALIELRHSGAISNDVWLRVGRDLDLEDTRLDI